MTDPKFHPTIPTSFFNGVRALPTQDKFIADTKNTLTFFTRMAWPTANVIASSSSVYIVISTGENPIQIFDVIVDFDGDELMLESFIGSTITDNGTAATVTGYNSGTSTTTIYQDATVSADGTSLGNPQYYYGSDSPHANPSTFPSGRLLVLPANTVFVQKVTNNSSTSTARFQYFFDWSEAPMDLPFNE